MEEREEKDQRTRTSKWLGRWCKRATVKVESEQPGKRTESKCVSNQSQSDKKKRKKGNGEVNE